ncbi:MAG TPA: aminotransferase class I/II-fold pyridoxal phosphate-dependent enzyme [Blastocatellia bacterium]|jgi:aspartate/methionine/tyrosine aminotransferase|nr:aminotransferase class I/II-fold pyridoxal phosphate-dependent enzyme [Blastocatellia bacterium]
MTSAKSHVPTQQVELRTGTPYANLIRNQRLFANAVGEHFGVSPGDVLPMAGTTGAIEAVRNHAFRLSCKSSPTVLTVCPGYWRARESFEGFGFEVSSLRTEPLGFTISEYALVGKAREENPDLIYLSLPNNPTGAIFDPAIIIAGAPQATAVIIDLTLPSRELDTRALTAKLYQDFKGRRNLFIVGSTSKSHETAEHRVGWVICANCEDAGQLRKENRNVVASVSIMEAMAQLGKAPTVLDLIERSFALLREGQKQGRFHVVTPEIMAETGYMLVKSRVPAEAMRRAFDENGISVMWGSEFGLTDEYIRLETLEPASISVFVDVINTYTASKRSAP